MLPRQLLMATGSQPRMPCGSPYNTPECLGGQGNQEEDSLLANVHKAPVIQMNQEGS